MGRVVKFGVGGGINLPEHVIARRNHGAKRSDSFEAIRRDLA